MSKLFVFGIGGTGSRVLKSLTMLLMAGVKTNVEEIIPIVIEKDSTNGDMVKTKRLIETYINTRDKFTHDSGKFFSTKMSLLNNNILLPLKDKKKKFSDYIDKDKLGKEDCAIVEALFSDKALNMETTEGFRGIPSIGSVVLNQFEQSDIFKTFANQFKSGDKIFIVSSIFGGTGASGFPLLVKTLRGAQSTLPNWDSVNSAPIGAISVLPYFIVGKANEEGKVNVDSDTFNSKAKAALTYYAQTLDGEIDYMYYAGDAKNSTFKYHAGGQEQKNDAHFVELVSAFSIIDFANKNVDGRSENTSYNEFGILSPQHKNDEIIFDDLHTDTKQILVNPLIQFYTFRQYMKLQFDKQNKHQPWSHNFPKFKKNNFDNVFRQCETMKNLDECLSSFNNWLTEMSNKEVHKRCFIPFNLSADTCSFVNGKSDKCVIVTDWRYKDWAWLDNELNKACTNKETQVSESMTKEQRFLEIFYRATEQFVKKLIPNSQDNQ